MPATPLAIALAVAAMLLGLPAAGAAHAELVRAEPAAGGARLAFDAPLERAFLRVEGPAGVPVPARRDPADPRAVLVAGAPSVVERVRVLSQDGHPGGSAARSDATPAHIVLRLLALAWPVLVLGLVVLRAGVVAPAYAAAGIAPPGRGRDPEGFRARAAPALAAASDRWWRALGWSLALGAAGLAGLPAALLWSLRQGPGGLGELVAETRWGHAWLAQVGALAVSAALAAALVRGPGRRSPAPGAALAAVGVPPAVALLAISWAGHASSEPDRVLNVAIDGVHNLATAAWLGGLVGLLALLPAATGRLDAADRVRLAAGVVVRFSALAIAAVTALVVTGGYRALVELGAVSDLWETGYGRALLVKLALFAVLLVAGGYNRLVLHPRLERAALGLDGDDRGAAGALRTSVRAELALAALLMVAVAALVSLGPPA